MKLDPCACHSWYVLHVTGYASVTYKAMKVLMLFCNSWTARITANMLQRGVCIWLLGLVGTNKASLFIPNCASL